MSTSVELREDRGEAAVEDEFFRSREFLGAEGVTHTLIAETSTGRVALPLVLRDIPGTELRDGISPYSYPGAKVEGEPPRADELDLAGIGLVSIFVRDRLGEPSAFAGGTERSVVLLSDPELPRKSRMSDRQQIRKNDAAGYETEVVHGPAVSDELLAGFLAVYEETMNVVGAGDRYYFDAEYFRALLGSPLTWMLATSGPEGDCAAAALAVRSDGFIHYYLSGTADAHRKRAPSKNLIVATTDFAEEQGLPMNLGGGVKPGDGLEEFKRGFANRELPFRTHEIVCDRAAYDRLSEGKPGGFFPAYRT